jgi:low affinity Fe/Cu permease
MSSPAAPPSRPHNKKGVFTRLAETIAWLAGSSWAFLVALGMVIVWGVTGPIFGFSNTWQLVINTGTTIITFLMVFLIQNSQNRDTTAIHLKLDEIIRAMPDAETALLDLEELSEDELRAIRKDYEKLAEDARHELRADAKTPKTRRKAA